MALEEDYLAHYEGARVFFKEKEEKKKASKHRRKRRAYWIISAIGVVVVCTLYVLLVKVGFGLHTLGNMLGWW